MITFGRLFIEARVGPFDAFLLRLLVSQSVSAPKHGLLELLYPKFSSDYREMLIQILFWGKSWTVTFSNSGLVRMGKCWFRINETKKVPAISIFRFYQAEKSLMDWWAQCSFVQSQNIKVMLQGAYNFSSDLTQINKLWNLEVKKRMTVM